MQVKFSRRLDAHLSEITNAQVHIVRGLDSDFVVHIWRIPFGPTYPFAVFDAVDEDAMLGTDEFLVEFE